MPEPVESSNWLRPLRAVLSALVAALALVAAPAASSAVPVTQAVAQGGSLLKSATSFTTYKDQRYSTTAGTKGFADVYVPNNGQAQNPTILWIHGGGFSGGDKADNIGLVQPVVKMGFVVVSVNYRLSGTAKFPAQIEDTKTAIRWIRAKASTYRVYPDKVAVWGSSAGGDIALLAGLTSGDTTWDTSEWTGQSSAVAAVQDDYGPVDLLKWTSNFALPDPNSWVTPLLGCRASTCPDKAANASPITYATIRGPPVAIWHGNADITVPLAQSTLLRDALNAAGTPNTYTVVSGMGHGQLSAYTAARVTAVGRWLDGILRP